MGNGPHEDMAQHGQSAFLSESGTSDKGRRLGKKTMIKNKLNTEGEKSENQEEIENKSSDAEQISL